MKRPCGRGHGRVREGGTGQAEQGLGGQHKDLGFILRRWAPREGSDWAVL